MARLSAASLRQSAACRFAVRLALLVFALRAVVPVGYMPDLRALGQGEVRIVICSGNGPQALLVDAAGQPLDNSTGGGARHGASGDCAFGMASAKPFTLPASGASPGHVSKPADPPVSHADHVLRPLAHGPPLGPRAPPIFLG